MADRLFDPNYVEIPYCFIWGKGLITARGSPMGRFHGKPRRPNMFVVAKMPEIEPFNKLSYLLSKMCVYVYVYINIFE